MDISIPRDTLTAAVETVSAAVGGASHLPIIGNLRIDTGIDGSIILTGTDMELEFTVQASATIHEPGATTIPAAKLKSIAKALPPGTDVRITAASNDRAVIKSGRSRYQVATLPADDFPAMGAMDNARRVTVPAAVLAQVLAKVAPCMSRSDVRYYLNGAYVALSSTGITAVSTDGHRLALYSVYVDWPGLDSMAVVLPFRAVHEYRKLLAGNENEITLAINDRMASVCADGVIANSKLVDGRFPEYEKVIPLLDNQATVDRVEFLNALRRAVILANDKYRGARVTFGNGQIEINASNAYQEEGNDVIDADYDGETMVIGLNIQYATDALSAIDTPRVVISIKDAVSSLIMRGEGADNETFVICPMRL